MMDSASGPTKYSTNSPKSAIALFGDQPNLELFQKRRIVKQIVLVAVQLYSYAAK